MALVSSSSATVAVDKATSDLLIGPDWTMNIDICDSINSNHWQAKDVVKAVKKRLQHKSPKVQLLALTLLETMVKNCGDYVHFQIAEKNILGEMVKIVKKKADMHVRDKILVLLDAWQEAFGGPGGKHPQYYWAYEELRRSGVEFPQRSLDAAPIFTPPVTHPTLRHTQAGYGMPSNSSRRLDETMATEIEGLSLSSLDSMRNVMELLSDMLQAVNLADRQAVKDEVIVDLVNQCRSNQKKLMQMVTTTGDEELLGRGLELNDSLQVLLAKHDAIASGFPIPTQVTSLSPKPSEGCSSNIKSTEIRDNSPRATTNSTTPVANPTTPVANPTMSFTNTTRRLIDEEEEEEDDFAQLARRHSKTQSSPQSTNAASRSLVLVDNSMSTDSTPASCNALALPDPPAPVRTTKEQDMIDLLSITLSTTSTSPSSHTSPASNQNMHQMPASSGTQYPYVSQAYPGGQGQMSYNTYVVPWAQTQPQHQLLPPSQPQLQPQPYQHLQPPSSPLLQPQPQQHLQPSSPPQLQPTQQHLQPPSARPLQPQPQQHLQPPTQPVLQPQTQQQLQPKTEPQSQPQPQPHPQQQFRPHYQPQTQSYQQPQLQSHYPQYSGYPPPPWAATPGYANSQNHMFANNNVLSTTQANTTASYTPMQAARPLQHYNSFPSRASNGSAINGDPRVSSQPRMPSPPGQKPFVPSYRLFEDLNVLGNADGRFKMTSSTSPSLSGSPGQSIVGGRK